MPVRSAHKDGLIELLGGDEYSKKAIELLQKYSRVGVIPKEELDEELLILFESERLALPINSEKSSLSWGARIVELQDLEIPYVIRIMFSEGLDWRGAVKRYFEKIGEKNPEDIVNVVEEIFESRKGRFVSGDVITSIASKHGREAGTLIAELKGAGIISPFAGCGRSLAKMVKIVGSPVYEINSFLLKLYESSL